MFTQTTQRREPAMLSVSRTACRKVLVARGSSLVPRLITITRGSERP